VTDDECTHLQRQIVELRMRMEQQAEAHAAVVEHAVSRAVDAKLGGRSLTEAEREWVRDAAAKAAEHKKMRGAVILHLVQWGIGGSVGFLLYSAWESIKAKVRQ
jgi:CHASE1-domain containing sensor protein